MRTRIAVVILGLALTACGGGGGGGGGSANPPPSTDTSGSKLFVGNAGTQAVVSFKEVNLPSGTTTPDRSIGGSNATLIFLHGLAVDSTNDRLYATTGNAIRVFDHAGTADGDPTPTRLITSTSFSAVMGLFLDTASDILYAVDYANCVLVFEHASTINGPTTPTRTITLDFGASAYSSWGMAVDIDRNLVYVSVIVPGSPTYSEIAVVKNASSANGKFVPDAVIRATPSLNEGPLFVDKTHDRLYAADSGGNAVRVFDNASTLNGLSISASKTLGLGASIVNLTVDVSNDRLYALKSTGLFIVNNVSTLSSGSVGVSPVYEPGGDVKSIAVMQ